MRSNSLPSNKPSYILTMPQHSLLTPLISNILFNAFDNFIHVVILRINLTFQNKKIGKHKNAIPQNLNMLWAIIISNTHTSSYMLRRILLMNARFKQQLLITRSLAYSGLTAPRSKIYYIQYYSDILLYYIGKKRESNILLVKIAS